MKPQLIRAERLKPEQVAQVTRWLKENGCPYMVPYDSPIHITGNHFTVETFTFRTSRQARTLLPRHIAGTIPTKIRKYRIRHGLRWTK